MKKIVVRVLWSFLLLSVGIMINDSSSLAANVGVTEENFPDASFRNYITQKIDKDKNGVLSEAEIQGTTKIVIEGDRGGESYNVTNYQGIGYFTELEELRIVAVIPMDPNDEEGCDISLYIFSLDVSDNLKLKRFACRAGEVNKLDLSVLPLLEEIELDVDKCPVQDLSRHTNLKKVRVEGHEGDHVKITLPKQMPFLESLSLRGGVSDRVALPEIDFSVSANLTELALMNLDITNQQLDLKNLTKLKTLNIGAYWKGCSMAEVNLEGCVGLETAYITGVNKVNFQGCYSVRELGLYEQLPEVSLTDLVNLEELRCADLNGKSFDLRNNKKLKNLTVTTCNFEEMLFPDKAKFQQMYLRENLQLAKVDLSGIQIETLTCEENKNLKELVLSKDGKYKKISAKNNHLEKLDLRGIKVDSLDCDKNNLKSLLLSKDGKYKKISVRKNKLTKLDLRGVKVDSICCNGNRIKKVLFSKSGKCNEVLLQYNQLTKLDLRGAKVKVLDCKNNKLRSLKVRGNKVLKELYCQRNRLKKLDVRGCKKLKIMVTAGNKKLKKIK